MCFQCDGVFDGVHAQTILASGAPSLLLIMAMNKIDCVRGLPQARVGGVAAEDSGSEASRGPGSGFMGCRVARA
jgi:hypothetical protein